LSSGHTSCDFAFGATIDSFQVNKNHQNLSYLTSYLLKFLYPYLGKSLERVVCVVLFPIANAHKPKFLLPHTNDIFYLFDKNIADSYFSTLASDYLF